MFDIGKVSDDLAAAIGGGIVHVFAADPPHRQAVVEFPERNVALRLSGLKKLHIVSRLIDTGAWLEQISVNPDRPIEQIARDVSRKLIDLPDRIARIRKGEVDRNRDVEEFRQQFPGLEVTYNQSRNEATFSYQFTKPSDIPGHNQRYYIGSIQGEYTPGGKTITINNLSLTMEPLRFAALMAVLGKMMTTEG